MSRGYQVTHVDDRSDWFSSPAETAIHESSERQSRKPWWRRKRWFAVTVLWLLLTYPLSLWPFAYAVGRGWFSETFGSAIYAPVISAAKALSPQPGIYAAPANAAGRRAIRFAPNPDPPPRLIGAFAEGYIPCRTMVREPRPSACPNRVSRQGAARALVPPLRLEHISSWKTCWLQRAPTPLAPKRERPYGATPFWT